MISSFARARFAVIFATTAFAFGCVGSLAHGGVIIDSIGGGGGVLGPIGTNSYFMVSSPDLVSVTTPPTSPINVFGDTSGNQYVKLNTFTVNLSTWNANPGPVVLPSTLVLTAVDSVAPGISVNDSVTFNVTGSTGTMSFDPATDVLGILANVTYASQTGFTGFDFSQITYFGLSAQVAASSPDDPGMITIGTASTASYTFTDALPTAAVPEPASLAIWGAFAVAGAWYGRRRLLRNQSVPS